MLGAHRNKSSDFLIDFRMHVTVFMHTFVPFYVANRNVIVLLDQKKKVLRSSQKKDQQKQ